MTKNKLNWKQRCYPELKSSGYDTFVVHQWIMNELHTLPESLPADLIACLWASNHFLSIWTNAGRWLSPAEHANVKEAGKIFIQAYCALAKKAARDQVRLYKVRPKLHLLHHLVRQETRKNPHYFATWMDEAGLKKLMKVLKLSDAMPWLCLLQCFCLRWLCMPDCGWSHHLQSAAILVSGVPPLLSKRPAPVSWAPRPDHAREVSCKQPSVQPCCSRWRSRRS